MSTNKFLKQRKFYLTFVICLCLAIAFSYFSGIRFNAIQAAKYNSYVNEKSILLGDVKIGSYRVFFYENDDKYRTVLTERVFPFWRLNGNSYWANKTDDNIKLVGWCSLNNGEKGVTTVPVQSFDKKVSYIKMGSNSDLLVKNIPYGEVVIFTWNKGIPWNVLNAIAYSSDNKPLYKLGYEIVNSAIKADELRWLPVN
ncbi:hypothetical protein JK636_18775 [Clostridium sp. YIM B02515]|uniref:DUF5044 domain-containing protein n=1 Tax=Clostridium rhizosphaerae TaxID=2803861 RepID=A0ABS1TEE6_9CLOT|nr:hypothetical protein [Clostridium rhizosphaerae]MBL4937753.1 hypothetical protein [Clostridium rhizosphaerae]